MSVKYTQKQLDLSIQRLELEKKKILVW